MNFAKELFLRFNLPPLHILKITFISGIVKNLLEYKLVLLLRQPHLSLVLLHLFLSKPKQSRNLFGQPQPWLHFRQPQRHLRQPQMHLRHPQMHLRMPHFICELYTRLDAGHRLFNQG